MPTDKFTPDHEIVNQPWFQYYRKKLIKIKNEYAYSNPPRKGAIKAFCDLEGGTGKVLANLGHIESFCTLLESASYVKSTVSDWRTKLKAEFAGVNLKQLKMDQEPDFLKIEKLEAENEKLKAELEQQKALVEANAELLRKQVDSYNRQCVTVADLRGEVKQLKAELAEIRKIKAVEKSGQAELFPKIEIDYFIVGKLQGENENLKNEVESYKYLKQVAEDTCNDISKIYDTVLAQKNKLAYELSQAKEKIEELEFQKKNYTNGNVKISGP